MKKVLYVLLMIVLSLTLVLSGCSEEETKQKGPIVVGSKIDTEGSLLAQIIILSLRDNGFEVTDKSQFGATSVVRKALETGELDIYPEYTGNGAFFFDEADSPIWENAAQAFARVKQLDEENNNITWLKPAPANNTWAIAVPRELASRENLTTLEDFAAYVNRGGYVKLIGSEEFVTSTVALPRFQQVYGFRLGVHRGILVAAVLFAVMHLDPVRTDVDPALVGISGDTGRTGADIAASVKLMPSGYGE